MVDRRSFLFGATAFGAVGTARAQAWPVEVPSHATVAGLSQPIEIVDDRWGVPHIRAATKADAFFGQGYVVARDRLFQIDFGHRRAMGRMAEVFGADFAEHDAAAQLFHYRGDLDAELARIPRPVLECVRGYVAGINARIAEVEGDPTLLPLEYRILGVLPLRWEVRDLVLARGGSVGNVDDEIRRARLAAMDLLALDRLVAPLRPAIAMTVPEGLDAAQVREADMGVLRLGPLPFGRETPTQDPDELLSATNAGSNAWTVAGSRTATGRPILANDPHLGIGGFGPRHVAHLTAPGLDVIGGGAPGLAGIMQGHTDRFAFGRTNFHIDQEDLFVLELDPQDPERYRHDGGWKRFTRVEIDIPVKDAPPHRAVLRYAVQGPVVSHDPGRLRATALASVGMQPGGSGAFSMVAINLAQDWASLREAFKLHPAPTNFHYADVRGHHGRQVIGFWPQRKRGNGLLPVPGDGRYDWVGMRDFRALPSDYDPPAGWFASANQNNLPPGWPAARSPAYSFRDSARYDRIAQVLSKQTRHSIADSIALQHDTLSLLAQRFQAMLPRQPSPGAAAATAMLARWDARIDGASGAAALYEIVLRQLNAQMLAALVPEGARSLIPAIEPPELLRVAAERPDLVDASLAASWTEATKLLGSDPAAWRWDALHRVRIAHPLARIPAIAAAFPPIEAGGSGGDSFTVMARWLGNGPDWRVGGGASYLEVIDVGDWDRSVMLNLPGQSNDPRSLHARDQTIPWIAGTMQPMPFSRAAVDAAAARTTHLHPERSPR
ncbi:penicillin acylase family protein [Sphingomonas pokkalii]|uniref:Penicillin acylase family protein n=1 Tax=Sphingomonas pokkalii TaxID=2175090 RepID=A0A2U0SCU1_9SPHN|nr:penicillin acylase family protein [Sphingomonas pokkalii]PVX29196.1 penicillin acylase family protein [Sphingomonas pokkalii]